MKNVELRVIEQEVSLFLVAMASVHVHPARYKRFFFFYVERVNIKGFFSLFTCHADFSGYGCLGGCTRGHA